MNTFTPLLAAGVDPETIFKILIALLVFIIPAIGQLLAKIRQMRPPPAEADPPPPVPADVADEIEEFMRRAAKQRGTRPAANAPQAKPAAAEPIPAQVVAEQQPVGGQVSEHVRKYLDEQEFRRHSEQLGEEVAQADRQIGQHLHQVFDHRMSKLEAVPGESAAPPTAEVRPELAEVAGEVPLVFGADLLDLITSPDSLRQAIILNEILHRPEERWE